MAEERPPRPLRTLILAAVCLALVAAAGVTVGARVLWAVGADLTAGPALGAAWAVAVLATVIAPIWLAARLLKGAGPEVHRPTVTLGSFALLNAVWLLLTVVATPSTTRAALEAHPSWAFPAAAPPSLEQAVLLGARSIPRTVDPVVEEPEPVEIVEEIVSAEPEPPAEPPPPWNAKDVFAWRADTVVVIHTQSPLNEDGLMADLAKRLGMETLEGTGSGFIVDPSGLIVTNHHVVHGAARARVDLRDGRRFDTVEVLATDPSRDLALIRVQAEGLPVAPLAEAGAGVVGEESFAIGSPLGLEYSLTQGIVSAERKMGGADFLQVQTTIAPGSSGGPLFNDHGQVIGVNTATASPGLNLSVRVAHVHDLLAAERKAQALEPFAAGVEVVALQIEGAELNPTTVDGLEDAARMIGTQINGCLEARPEGDRLVIELGPMSTLFSKPQIEPEPEGSKCLREGLSLLSMPLRMMLSEEAPSERIVLRATFAGMKAHSEDDTRPPQDRQLELALGFGTPPDPAETTEEASAEAAEGSSEQANP
ncbi:MAG: trypsin-like peptidase domain-containing protein [Alphaproteobacteria bacterium]|nr:trypsin-like peptidase domain-containing protein [Alphaproteobacteria bacterium]